MELLVGFAAGGPRLGVELLEVVVEPQHVNDDVVVGLDEVLSGSVRFSFGGESVRLEIELENPGNYVKGASSYDVRKIFGFFGPFPPCPHFDLIYKMHATSLTTSAFS